ncbi:hypothetical protein KI387_033204, partial [Taxus chinensis]
NVRVPAKTIPSNGTTGKKTSLPAAASWGLHATLGKTLPTKAPIIPVSTKLKLSSSHTLSVSPPSNLNTAATGVTATAAATPSLHSDHSRPSMVVIGSNESQPSQHSTCFVSSQQNFKNNQTTRTNLSDSTVADSSVVTVTSEKHIRQVSPERRPSESYSQQKHGIYEKYLERISDNLLPHSAFPVSSLLQCVGTDKLEYLSVSSSIMNRRICQDSAVTVLHNHDDVQLHKCFQKQEENQNMDLLLMLIKALFIHGNPLAWLKHLHSWESAWNKDPLTALKLVCQLRGVRGMGTSDRNGFYTAAYWIHCNHPHTLAANVCNFGEFGYLKDLPEVLLRVLKDHKNVRKRRIQRKPVYRFDRKGAVAREAMKLGTLMPREERIAADLLKGKQDKENARVAREQRQLEDASRALQRYHQDPLYRALHDKISLHFSDLLVKDLEAIKSQKNPRLTLAAKWCPSLDSSYHLSTLLCENIACRVFPREEYADVVDDRHYAYRVCERLRKEVLVPLRKTMHFPEVYMSANLWGELRYNRVASVAMKNYKGLFFEHDSKRSAEFLGDVKKGKKKIAAGALLPHEILEQ